MLAHLLNLIKVNIHNAHDQAMFAAATLLAFFGMLRISEYTTPSPRCFDPHAHLSINDISFNFRRRMLSVRIKASKTDPFRQGMTLRIAFNFSPLCPGLAMLRYFRSRTGTDGPLFIFCSGDFLTRAHLSDLLRYAFPTQQVTTHSFRRGGASALAAWGVPQYTIQILGRWRSDAYIRYLQVDDNFITSANRLMAQPPSPN